MLAANSPQEAQDFAVIAQAATLAGRIPVIHFFDGFRTSHEVAKIVAVEPDTVRAMLDADLIAAHRTRALSPEHPVLRGTSQNPDVFFQSRERANPFYDADATTSCSSMSARRTPSGWSCSWGRAPRRCTRRSIICWRAAKRLGC
jgi:pyruvate/2-oxoacid:ferredoxin oxidoreductase alpha subunit